MSCTSNGDCNNFGVCKSSVCICDLYIDGAHCEHPFAEEVGESILRVEDCVCNILLCRDGVHHVQRVLSVEGEEWTQP